jgi:hypothetical protein
MITPNVMRNAIREMLNLFEKVDKVGRELIEAERWCMVIGAGAKISDRVPVKIRASVDTAATIDTFVADRFEGFAMCGGYSVSIIVPSFHGSSTRTTRYAKDWTYIVEKRFSWTCYQEEASCQKPHCLVIKESSGLFI